MQNAKRWTAVLCLIAASVLLHALFPVHAAAADPTCESVMEDILAQSRAGASAQAWAAEILPQEIGQNAEWYVFALRDDPSCDFSAYHTALQDYLRETKIPAAATRQKFALALLMTGGTDDFVQETVNSTIGQQGVMSLIFGLHLLNNGCVSTSHTQADTTQALLNLQLPDGGWAVMGAVSDADVTAMAIQALAPQYDSDSAVQASIDRAVALLSDTQLETGEFSSYGIPNPESAAQVWIALSSLEIDARTDARFIKNGATIFDGILRYRLPDGTFCHQAEGASDPAATTQVFLSLAAYQRLQSGSTSLYIIDAEHSGSSVTDTVTTAQTESAENDPQQKVAPSQNTDYRPYACAAVILLGTAICIVICLRKPRAKKNCIVVMLLTAAAVCTILFVEIRTADEYYADRDTRPASITGTVTLSIRCDEITDTDPEILAKTEYAIGADTTVYQLLLNAAKEHRIQLETSGAVDAVYVRGIANLYEFDHGALSGWLYEVNGTQPSVSCAQYVPQDGDEIVWYYSCAPESITE